MNSFGGKGKIRPLKGEKMTAKKESLPGDFQKCAEFHGHICPGLAIGYRAAKAGMDWLAEKRAEDEEVVAIVETDACGADAIQVLTGCTFGKGNFIHRDFGKQAFTLLGRRTGRGVRLALRAGALDLSGRHRELLDRIREGSATAREREEFQKLHEGKFREIMEKPLPDLFSMQEVAPGIPPKAKIEPSKPCQICGEPTMGSKMQTYQGKEICRSCHPG
jgi:formylmethanofuran dehydrogenase subunit E